MTFNLTEFEESPLFKALGKHARLANMGLTQFTPINSSKGDPVVQELLTSLYSEIRNPKTDLPCLDYSGHQFCHFTPQLGDGRTVVLSVEKDEQGKNVYYTLKGGGPTVFANGDGFMSDRELADELIGSQLYCQYPATHIAFGRTAVTSEYRKPRVVLLRRQPTLIRFGTLERLAYLKNLEALESVLKYSYQNERFWACEFNYNLMFREMCYNLGRNIKRMQDAGLYHTMMNTDNILLDGNFTDIGNVHSVEENFDNSAVDPYGRFSFENQKLMGQFALSIQSKIIPYLTKQEKTDSILMYRRIVELEK